EGIVSSEWAPAAKRTAGRRRGGHIKRCFWPSPPVRCTRRHCDSGVGHGPDKGDGPCTRVRDGSRKDGSRMNRSVLAREVGGAIDEGWAGSRPGLDRAFRAASRHSRYVRFLRVALPASVAVAAIAIALATWFSPARLLAKLPTGGSLGSVGISGSRVTMALPRLEGYTRDARPYQLTAKSAAQDLLKPDNVELSEIRTKMETADKAVVEMTAVT